MANILILFSAAFLLATAFVHSVIGERKLITPLLATRKGILDSNLACMVLRFAWHITSITWIILAFMLVTFAFYPNQVLPCSLLAIGTAFTIMGIYSALVSRGRFIGWPFLTGVGVCALAALVSGR
jgi:hypothetical protein